MLQLRAKKNAMCVLMLRFSLYRAQNQLAVLFGLFCGALIDLAVRAGAPDYWFWDAFYVRPLSSALLLVGSLCVLAIWLEGYIKPLSHIGALMTGFCCYAVIGLFLT